MMKTQLMNNLMTYNNGPDYMTKLRVKKREIMDKKKTSKKNILNCQIELKSEEAIKFY